MKSLAILPLLFVLGYLFELVLVLTTCLDGWVARWVALEEWKVRLTSAKVEAEVEAELGKKESQLTINFVSTFRT